MSDDDNIVTQDEIDNLLAEMSEESGEQKKVKEKEVEHKDPAMDPEAWGLSEDDLQAEPEGPAAPVAKTPPPPPKTKDVELQQFDRQAPKMQAPRALDFVLDIPLVITVEVGRNKMTIGDLLTLGPGSIVELTKMAGEPLEIFVNNKLVARGEAVIVNEKCGVRLTDVISKTERIESLK